MWPFESTCAYCGETGAGESCNDCGRSFHEECAREAGDLRIKQQVSDLLSTAPTKYLWDCPDCDREAHGKR